jgi:hypothetical protein
MPDINDCNNKEWILLDYEDCPWCGGDIEVQVSVGKTDFYDKDPVRCTDSACGLLSFISADENGWDIDPGDED